jgi:beta-galactosidase
VDGGKLLAFGSANPCTAERYDCGSHTTFYGRALAIVQRDCAGEIVIHVDADDLASALATVKVIEQKTAEQKTVVG